MSRVTNGDLMDVFREEAQDLISRMQKDLSDLRGQPSSIPDDLFRYAHTVKSSAGSVGFDQLKGLMQGLEQVFGRLRGGEHLLEDEEITLLCKCADRCQQLLNSDEVTDCNELLALLDRIPRTRG